MSGGIAAVVDTAGFAVRLAEMQASLSVRNKWDNFGIRRFFVYCFQD